jgi:hypothetical protein
MTAIPPQPPQGSPAPAESTAAIRPAPGDELLPEIAQRFLVAESDCCIARPGYRVVLRPKDGGDPQELYLCGHHYRASTAALLVSQATVYDSANRLIA